MSTGDGLLVRFQPREQVSPEAFIALCAAARRYGNGILEITARGSLQVRGLSAQSAPAFASTVAALNVAQTCDVPVISDPLSDDRETLIDAAAIACDLRRAIDRAGFVLAPKFSIALDGGGRLHLDALVADVRLRAIGPAQAPRLHLALAGDARTAAPLGAITPAAAVDVVVGLLGVIASRSGMPRAADILRNEGVAPFRAVVEGHIETAPAPPSRAAAEPIGRHPLRGVAVALGVAPAFGQADAAALAQLARIAADHGARWVRTAPGRALLLSPLMEDAAAAFAGAADRLGFVTHAEDPRRRIDACAGRPACASGWIAARALAAEIAQKLPIPFDGIHVSGCAKGCAHPAPATLTVVGSERGCGIVRHGSARATPRYYVDPGDLVAELAHEAAGASEGGDG
jgi:precorrin-3B synthase